MQALPGALEPGLEGDRARRVETVEADEIGAHVKVERLHHALAHDRVAHPVADGKDVFRRPFGQEPFAVRDVLPRIRDEIRARRSRQLEMILADVQQEARGIFRRAVKAAPCALGEIEPLFRARHGHEGQAPFLLHAGQRHGLAPGEDALVHRAEEDVGKLTHGANETYIDFNRAGTPLIEIVSEPDMHSPEEAFAYLKSLEMHLRYIGASDCDMEKGQMRCDANVSIRPVGSTQLGTKVELKNLNSISGVCSGIRYEIQRQIEVLESNGHIEQETRRWDTEKLVSTSMRSKEDAHDYRYFTDPDLFPITLSDEVIQAQRDQLPELPFAKQERYQQELKLPYTLTSVLCPDCFLSNFFDQTHALYPKNPLAIANWIANDLLREMAGKPWSELKLTPPMLAELVQLIDGQVLSKQNAKDVFVEMIQSGLSAKQIVQDKGLEMKVDIEALKTVCQEVINAFPQPVAEYRSGKEKAINVLKGQIMKRTQGKAPIDLINQLLIECLNNKS